MTVTDRFTERDDVGNDSPSFEGPHSTADTPESHLHFIGDAKPAGRTHVLVGMLQVSWWRNDLTSDTAERFGDQGGGRAVTRQHGVDLTFNGVGVVPSGIRIGVTEPSAVAIGARDGPDIIWASCPILAGELVVTNVD